EVPDPLRLADIFAAMLVFFIEQSDGVGIAFERGEGVLDQLLQRQERIARADRQVPLLVAEALIHPLECCDKQALFGLEVIIQHVLADVAALGDAVDPRALKSDPAKLFHGQFQYLLANASRIAATTRQDALPSSMRQERSP